MNELGVAYLATGDAQPAIGVFEECIRISREIGDRRGVGAALGHLGLAYASLGKVREAIQCYEQQLDVVREMGDRRGEGAALGNLGLAYADLGDVRKATQYHEQQLVIARQIGDRQGEGNALGKQCTGLRTRRIDSGSWCDWCVPISSRWPSNWVAASISHPWTTRPPLPHFFHVAPDDPRRLAQWEIPVPDLAVISSWARNCRR